MSHIAHNGHGLYHKDGTPACTGDKVKSHLGDEYVLTGGAIPSRPGLPGKVYVNPPRTFFASVFDLEWKSLQDEKNSGK